MSDDWVILIPANDPHYAPDIARRHRARTRFAEIAPKSEEIEAAVTTEVTFFDCGANFERVLCPSCRSELSTGWWQECMEEDFDKGFRLAKYLMPCCGSSITLHELIYEWPQGFGQFALSAMNPNVGMLDDRLKREFEEILGTELRVIYQHI